MKRPELLGSSAHLPNCPFSPLHCGCAEMTASEPLTLEQEYAMQQSWAKDPDSTCVFGDFSLTTAAEHTFIILDRSLPDTPGISTTGGGTVVVLLCCCVYVVY